MYVSLTRRGFLGCTVGMVALAGCIGSSPEVRVYSGRDESVTTTVCIATDTSEEPVVDESIIVKPPSSGNAVEYSIQTGKTYQVTINTDDGITGDYRWDVPPNAGHRSLTIEIGQSDIEFAMYTS